jgi:rhodanese-related sulfurtransferase
VTIEEISAVDAAAAVDAGAWLLDVRNDDEWEAGRAPSANYVTLGELPQRIAEVPTDQPIIVVCRAGARSAKAVELLGQHGVHASNLVGGMQAWSQAGLPVIDASGAPGQVI